LRSNPLDHSEDTGEKENMNQKWRWLIVVILAAAMAWVESIAMLRQVWQPGEEGFDRRETYSDGGMS
jgi:uncharacterized protein YpmS